MDSQVRCFLGACRIGLTIAGVAGPLLGGVFTDKATWRWCFYINLPIGAITVAMIVFFFKSPERQVVGELTWREKAAQMDLIGTAIFIPAVICLLLALQWGGSKYEWNSARIIVLFVLAGLLLIGFVAVQLWRPETATVAPRIIKQRSVWGSAIYSFCMGASFFTIVYFLPM
jgi:MFS family permease